MLIEKTLNCGIRMAMEKIPYVQSAAVGIWVKAGSADEDDRINGISHYIEHMLFKGTDNRTAKQIAEDVDRIGGNINAFTGKEATCYYIKTLDSNLEQACDILIDMFLNSQFDEVEMDKERMVILEEMKMTEDTPDDLAHDLLFEQVFQGTPLERQIIGTEKSLAGIRRQDIIDYIKKEYTRDSIVISLAGNFDEDYMCSYFEGRLAQLTASKPERTKSSRIYVPKFQTRVKDVEQSHICMGVPGIELDNDDLYYPMVLLNNIMGGSMSSRLFQNIREEKGLAYSVYSGHTSYMDAGAYFIYAGINSNKIQEAIEGIACELQLLKREGVTADELAMAKEQSKSSYIFGLENVNSRMFANGKNILLLNEVREPQRVLAEIDAVTMDDMVRAAELICDMGQYCATLVTNRDVDLKAMIDQCL
ncbi:MAG: insulinase family protein [Firmicutes bacterium]|nr:insulinase family protein [Bacillota bacterium]